MVGKALTNYSAASLPKGSCNAILFGSGFFAGFRVHKLPSWSLRGIVRHSIPSSSTNTLLMCSPVWSRSLQAIFTSAGFSDPSGPLLLSVDPTDSLVVKNLLTITILNPAPLPISLKLKFSHRKITIFIFEPFFDSN